MLSVGRWDSFVGLWKPYTLSVWNSLFISYSIHMWLSKVLLFPASIFALLPSQGPYPHALENHLLVRGLNLGNFIFCPQLRDPASEISDPLLRRVETSPCRGRNGPNKEACLKEIERRAKLCRSCKVYRANELRKKARCEITRFQ